MKVKQLLSCLFVILYATSFSFAKEGWVSDLSQGLAKGKPVLALFTGSDWSSPCINLEKNVLSKPEFLRQASKNYVLVFVDQPNKNQNVAKANMKYFKKYKIASVPTVLIIQKNGTVIDRFSADSVSNLSDFLARIDPKNIKK